MVHRVPSAFSQEPRERQSQRPQIEVTATLANGFRSVVRAQMERKHPATEEHDWPIPDEADINMGRLKEILSKAAPLVDVC